MESLNDLIIFGESIFISRLTLLILFTIITVIVILPIKDIISKPAQMIIGLAMFFIIITKPIETPDYIPYINAFLYNTADTERFEVSWKIIRQFTHNLNYGIILTFSFYAILGIFLKIRAICKMSNYVWISILIWVSHTFILHDMIQIRASVAAGFLLWGIYFKCNNNIKKSIFALVLGSCFHYSAILGFVIFLFSNKKNSNNNIYILAILLSIVFGLLGLSLTDFIPKSIINSHYLNSGSESLNIVTKMNIFRSLYAIILWYFYSQIVKHSSYFSLLLKVYTLGCCIMFLFSRPAILGLRISEFLCVTEIILLPMILYIFPRQSRQYYKIIPVTSAILLFISSFTSTLYFPYIYEQ